MVPSGVGGGSHHTVVAIVSGVASASGSGVGAPGRSPAKCSVPWNVRDQVKRMLHSMRCVTEVASVSPFAAWIEELKAGQAQNIVGLRPVQNGTGQPCGAGVGEANVVFRGGL